MNADDKARFAAGETDELPPAPRTEAPDTESPDTERSHLIDQPPTQVDDAAVEANTPSDAGGESDAGDDGAGRDADAARG